MIRIANAPCSWGVLEFDRQSTPPYALVLEEERSVERPRVEGVRKRVPAPEERDPGRRR